MSDSGNYWLMKSEPSDYSIDDLKRDKIEPWDGVRNYEARNFMRDDMKIGDKVFFYHSNAKPIAIVGIMEVASKPYPDPTQFNPNSKYFDEKSSESNPRWMLVDVKFVKKFDKPVTRAEMKKVPELENMKIFKRIRLSITPVTKSEWEVINKMAEN